MFLCQIPAEVSRTFQRSLEQKVIASGQIDSRFRHHGCAYEFRNFIRVSEGRRWRSGISNWSKDDPTPTAYIPKPAVPFPKTKEAEWRTAPSANAEPNFRFPVHSRQGPQQ